MDKLCDNASWKLEKYGRNYTTDADHITPKRTQQGPQDEDWVIYQAAEENLQFVITSSCHIVITSNGKIQENHSLWDAQNWLTGITKGDSMLFVLKSKSICRKFRIKFADVEGKLGVDYCKDCSKMLASYFPIKSIAENKTECPDGIKDISCVQQDCISGESDMFIGNVAEILSRQQSGRLNVMCRNLMVPYEEMELFIKMCLSDSNFPTFVESVENQLHTFRTTHELNK